MIDFSIAGEKYSAINLLLGCDLILMLRGDEKGFDRHFVVRYQKSNGVK